jgi:hypothetical protein
MINTGAVERNLVIGVLLDTIIAKSQEVLTEINGEKREYPRF